MANFEIAYSHTMAIEGGWVNNPNDSGKETYKGISRKNFPNWDGWVKIDAIKRKVGVVASSINLESSKDTALQASVKSFYKKNFWDVNRLDDVKYQSIGNESFDTGINMGVSYGALFLQEALNLCNKNQQSYPDIVVDGKIGPATLSVLNTKANEKVVFNTMNMLQAERYLKIMRANKSQETFWFGWLKRILLS